MKKNIEKMMVHAGMTINDMREDLKRPKFKAITLEVIGSIAEPELPLFKEMETLHGFLDRLNAIQMAHLYKEVCHAVFNAAVFGTEEQYGLNKED